MRELMHRENAPAIPPRSFLLGQTSQQRKVIRLSGLLCAQIPKLAARTMSIQDQLRRRGVQQKLRYLLYCPAHFFPYRIDLDRNLESALPADEASKSDPSAQGFGQYKSFKPNYQAVYSGRLLIRDET